MTHIFDDKKFKKLDSPHRRKILPIETVLDYIGLTNNQIIADVGCGIGYFAFPFAETAKTVLAIDVSQVMIDELSKRNQKKNIVPLKGDFSEVLKEKVDIFFTSTLLHELDDLDEFTRNAIKHLSKDGRLIFLDFRKKETGVGPDVDKRIPAEEVQEIFKKNKLKDIRINYINEIFYIVEGKL